MLSLNRCQHEGPSQAPMEDNYHWHPLQRSAKHRNRAYCHKGLKSRLPLCGPKLHCRQLRAQLLKVLQVLSLLHRQRPLRLRT